MSCRRRHSAGQVKAHLQCLNLLEQLKGQAGHVLVFLNLPTRWAVNTCRGVLHPLAPRLSRACVENVAERRAGPKRTRIFSLTDSSKGNETLLRAALDQIYVGTEGADRLCE